MGDLGERWIRPAGTQDAAAVALFLKREAGARAQLPSSADIDLQVRKNGGGIILAEVGSEIAGAVGYQMDGLAVHLFYCAFSARLNSAGRLALLSAAESAGRNLGAGLAAAHCSRMSDEFTILSAAGYVPDYEEADVAGGDAIAGADLIKLL